MNNAPKPQESDDNVVVRETREVRERLWRQGGGTSKGFIDLMKRLAEQRRPSSSEETSHRKSA